MALRLFRMVVLVALGAALQVTLTWALKRFLDAPDSSVVPMWRALSFPVFHAAARVAPAFLIGFLAKRHGFLLGALIGFASQFQISGFLRDPTLSLLLSSVYGLSAALITSLAGAAGELLASRRLPPNKSFKPNPLRGSA